MKSTLTKTLITAALLVGLFAAPASAILTKGDSIHDLHALIDADLKKIANRENGAGVYGRYFKDFNAKNEAVFPGFTDKVKADGTEWF